jgi:UDP-N-acetylglucosamine kinase
MTPDSDTTQLALDFARLHKRDIAARLTRLGEFPPDSIPVTVFMAGSPGAGKTESAHSLIARFSSETKILHIDTDALRSEFADYTGTNAALFQGATSVIADKMQDYALEQSQSYVFDGTFTNTARSRENIERNLKRLRPVFIVYVYQDPLQAWHFVQARQKKDGRNVPKEDFVAKYFQARANVNQFKEEYGDRIQLDVIVKNVDGSDLRYNENVMSVDEHVPETYTKETLEKVLANTL